MAADSAPPVDRHVVASATPAKFVTGSTLRHVIVMTATGSLGIMAIFVVDLLNLFYIARLGDTELTAAAGYGSTLSFATTSVCIGMMIATSALVSRALGAGDRERARHFGVATTVWMVIACVVVAGLTMPLVPVLLRLLGATGRVYDEAWLFMMITTPSLPLMGLGLAFSGVLRAVGDARGAMNVTLAGAVVAAIVDPILIWVLDLDLVGAAIAFWFTRTALAFVGWWGAVRKHDLVGRPTIGGTLQCAGVVWAIALPAVLTNLATPVANAYMTGQLAAFGDAAVAANAVIGRLVPVAFGFIFALSGAIGPIFGQNLGARRHDRLMQTLKDAFGFCVVVGLSTWAVLVVMREPLVDVFGINDPRAAELVIYFCLFVAGSWIFHGFLFVANAAFNNLGFPLTSTLFNWGKATIGTVPFAWAGAKLAGAEGALMGQAVGAVVFGLFGVWWAFRVVRRLAADAGAPVSSAAPVAAAPRRSPEATP